MYIELNVLLWSYIKLLGRFGCVCVKYVYVPYCARFLYQMLLIFQKGVKQNNSCAIQNFGEPFLYSVGLYLVGCQQVYLFSAICTLEGWNFNSGNYLFTTDTK